MCFVCMFFFFSGAQVSLGELPPGRFNYSKACGACRRAPVSLVWIRKLSYVAAPFHRY